MLTHQMRIWHLFLVGLLLGITVAFDNPARQIFVAETVPCPDLMNIITLNPFMLAGARTAGPAMADILVAVASEGRCFNANSAPGLRYRGGPNWS
jgi:hypothetical protein